MWIAEHETDVASDLSVFHRIDDPAELAAPKYFELAFRLGAYAGVIAARIEAEREEERKRGDSSPTGRTSPGAAPSEPTRVADTTAIAMLSDGWVEHVKEEG